MIKYVILVLVSLLANIQTSLARDISYGYNAHGDYVPVSIGGERVDYGYNAHGDYVPTSIGGKDIDYGYNARGDYVPTSLGGY